MGVDYYDLKIPDNSTNYITLEQGGTPSPGQEGLLVGDKFISINSESYSGGDYTWAPAERTTEIWQCVDYLRDDPDAPQTLEMGEVAPLFESTSEDADGPKNPTLAELSNTFIIYDDDGNEYKATLSVPGHIETKANVTLEGTATPDDYFQNEQLEEVMDYLVTPINNSATDTWHLQAINIDFDYNLGTYRVVEALYTPSAPPTLSGCFNPLCMPQGEGKTFNRISTSELDNWRKDFNQQRAIKVKHFIIGASGFSVNFWRYGLDEEQHFEGYTSSDKKNLEDLSAGSFTVGSLHSTSKTGTIYDRYIGGTLTVSALYGQYHVRESIPIRNYWYRPKARPIFVRLSDYPVPGSPVKRTVGGSLYYGADLRDILYRWSYYPSRISYVTTAQQDGACPYLMSNLIAKVDSLPRYYTARLTCSEHITNIINRNELGAFDVRIPSINSKEAPIRLRSEPDGGQGFMDVVSNAPFSYSYSYSSDTDLSTINIGDVFTASVSSVFVLSNTVTLKPYQYADSQYMSGGSTDSLFVNAPIKYNKELAKNMLKDGLNPCFGSESLSFADSDNPSISNTTHGGKTASIPEGSGLTVAFSVDHADGDLAVPICQISSQLSGEDYTVVHKDGLIYLADNSGDLHAISSKVINTGELYCVAIRHGRVVRGSDGDIQEIVVYFYGTNNPNPEVTYFWLSGGKNLVTFPGVGFLSNRPDETTECTGSAVTLFQSTTVPNTLLSSISLSELYITNTYHKDLERYA